jgi:hypothetical protein
MLDLSKETKSTNTLHIHIILYRLNIRELKELKELPSKPYFRVIPPRLYL